MPYCLPQNFKAEYDQTNEGGMSQGHQSEIQRVEPGQYLAKIVKPGRKIINNKQVLEPIWEILAAIDGSHTPEVGKKTVSGPLFMTEKAIWRFASFCKMLKIIVSDPKVFYDSALVGRFAAVEVIEEFYTRKDGTEGVKTIIGTIVPPPAEVGTNEPVDASDPSTDLPF